MNLKKNRIQFLQRKPGGLWSRILQNTLLNTRLHLCSHLNTHFIALNEFNRHFVIRSFYKFAERFPELFLKQKYLNNFMIRLKFTLYISTICTRLLNILKIFLCLLRK